jgi:asparagine synthase (glutamine-hydrolysing)
LGQKGSRLIERLYGNFALYAVCHPERSLLMARDRLGGRTLFYANHSGHWHIGPTAEAVLRSSGLPPRQDAVSIAAHFSGVSVPAGRTCFEGVRELQAGEILTVDIGGARSRQMAVSATPVDDYSDTTECVATFQSLFDEAVTNRLPAHGPAAIMLSGGMDSGPLAESAARQLRDKGEVLHPVSWRLPDFPEADESYWIHTLCRHLDLDPHWIDPQYLPFGQLDDSMISPDWPSFNAFRHLINACYRMAAESGCSVILNGNAGDNLYMPFHLLYRGYWLDGDWRLIRRDLAHIVARGGWRALASHRPIRHLFGRLRPGRRNPRAPEWLVPAARPDWRRAHDSQSKFEDHALPEYAAQLLGPRMTSGRCHEQYFADLHGVERRDPFHDEDLVGFMLRAPASLNVREGRTKWIMREAMRGRLPDGFRLKQRTGLLNSYFLAGVRANRQALERLLFEESPGWQRWLRPEFVRSALSQPEKRLSVMLPRCVGYALWARHWGV